MQERKIAKEERPELDDLGERLAQSALSEIAAVGFAKPTLRTIAARAACSTGAIVQRFGNRDGLLREACARALDAELAYHRDLQDTIAAFRLTEEGIADLIAHYILDHARRDGARLFLWASIEGAADAESRAALARWHRVRVDLWCALLAPIGIDADRAGAAVRYILMEEYYATAIAGDVTYALLLNESVRAFLRSSDAQAQAESVAGTINEQPRLPTADPARAAPVRERLVRAAADEILANGVEMLNQRGAARIAHASASAITYHFGDMESFINEAILNALLRDIPPQLDPAGKFLAQPVTMEQWLTGLVPFLRPRDAKGGAGFYTNFSRITGQMCLLVATRPALRPLAQHLRALEGWGTYRASSLLTDPAFAIRRDHAAAFAIWIKGEAILRNIGVGGDAITASTLIDGANAIFPRG